MSLQLSPKDLEVVRLIASNGSLTTTAGQMHVSQPAISQRLASLQDRLGTILFHRSDGRMKATPVAERLAEAAVAVDRVLEQALHDVSELLEQRQRRFRITAQCHTSYRWLSFVIRDLVAAHPDLSVDVVPEAIENPCAAVENGEVDAALVFAVDENREARAIELFSDELYAVMRHDHPLADRSYLNPANFEDEALILYAGKRHAFVDHVLAPAGVVPGRLRQVRMTEAIVELARAGQGIAVLAGWVLNDLGSRHDLTAVRIGRGGYRRTWRALLADDCPAAVADSFIESVHRTAAAIDSDDWRKQLEVA